MNEEQFEIWKIQKEREYELELESFRNNMAERGLAQSSIRLKGERDIRAKFDSEIEIVRLGLKGIRPTLNGILLNVNGKIYRVNNNSDKFERAKNSAGIEAGDEKILAHYDRFGGYIQDENGDKVINGFFWKKEEERIRKSNQWKNRWKIFRLFTAHPVVAPIILVLISAISYYVFKIDLLPFKGNVEINDSAYTKVEGNNYGTINNVNNSVISIGQDRPAFEFSNIIGRPIEGGKYKIYIHLTPLTTKIGDIAYTIELDKNTRIESSVLEKNGQTIQTDNPYFSSYPLAPKDSLEPTVDWNGGFSRVSPDNLTWSVVFDREPEYREVRVESGVRP